MSDEPPKASRPRGPAALKRPGGPPKRPYSKGPRSFGTPKPKTRKITGSDDTLFLFGLHPARTAWANPARVIRRLLVTENGAKNFGPPDIPEGVDRPAPESVERAALDRLLPDGAVHQGVVIEVEPLPEVDLSDLEVAVRDDRAPLIVALDQVTDPHNVGAVLRSAAAFGASALVVTRRHAPDETGVLAKSASGALDSLPIVRVRNLSAALDDLSAAGARRVGFDERGAPLGGAEVDFTGPLVLVFGAEGKGLRPSTRERCDLVAALPTAGPIASLNVSNAAAVALYEARRQRGPAAP